MCGGFRLDSQVSAICDKGQMTLAWVRELEWILYAERAMIAELEREVDAKRLAKQ